MNWAWATSLDQIWRSPSFPLWLTLSAAAFFGIIVLLMLLRTEQSVASGALAIITLLSLGIAVASILRGYEPAAQTASAESKSAPPIAHVLPALSCVDDLAGETVGQACERAVFASPESTAAAVNYAASMITRVVSLGDAASAQRTMSSDMQATRRAIERDRYGLMAHVLLTRERCTPTQCAAYRSLTDNHQIITNMDEHAFDNLVARYASSWNAPQITSATTPLAMMPPSVPTGRPTNAEFPSSANTPAVSIMTPEPGTGTKPPATSPPAPARPAQSAAAPPPAAPTPAAPPPAAKKQAATKRAPAPPAGPTQISPAAQAPAASDD
jgi:hypothetical protein